MNSYVEGATILAERRRIALREELALEEAFFRTALSLAASVGGRQGVLLEIEARAAERHIEKLREEMDS